MYVLYEQKKKTAYITLNRPHKHNALHTEMIQALSQAFHRAAEAPQIGIVVLQAMGPTFCAGIDLYEVQALQNKTPKENQIHAQTLADLLYQLYTFPKIVIGAVQGPAIGGGGGLNVVLDLVFCTPQATWHFPELSMGWLPAIVMPFLMAKLGALHTKNLVYGGKKINAIQAQSIGLVYTITPNQTAMQQTIQTWITQQNNNIPMLQATKNFFLQQQAIQYPHLSTQLTEAVNQHVLARKNLTIPF